MTQTFTAGGPCSAYVVIGEETLDLIPQAWADSIPVPGMQKNKRTSWNQPDTNDVLHNLEQQF